MSTMPYVRPHLIREVMNIIRLRGDGDAMLQLALADNEYLRTLNYIAENHFAIIVNNYRAEVGLDTASVNLRSSNQGLLYLTYRYAKQLRIAENGDLTQLPEGFPTENITDLCIDSPPTKVDIQLLTSMPNLESVKMKGGHPELFHHRKRSSIQLGHMRSLKMESLTMQDINEVLYGKKVPPQPFPHSLSEWRKQISNLPIEDYFFPQAPLFEPLCHVKHLEMQVEITQTQLDSFFKKFPRIFKYFPSAETCELMVMFSRSVDFVPRNSLYQCLLPTKFRGKMTLKIHEIVRIPNVSSFAAIKVKAKSVGFKETPRINQFVKRANFPCAKLIHLLTICL
uniref:Uncharacterized protein n=1 Tax=Panagrellus redivivus TaxID=6233 RepID=A0A7E4VMT7_PANRE